MNASVCQGMREMREARAIRKYKRDRQAERKERRRTGGGLSSLFVPGEKSTSRGWVGIRGGNRSRQHADSHRLVGRVNHKQSRRSRGTATGGQQHYTTTRRASGR